MPQTPQSPDPDEQKNAQPSENDGSSAEQGASNGGSGSGLADNGSAADASPSANDAGKGTAPGSESASPTAVTLQDLLESSQKTAALQQSLKNTYQALPAVLQIAGEIMKKRDEGEQALEQGMKVVEKMLQETITNAEALSSNLIKQTDLLKEALQDKDALAGLLKSGGSGQPFKSVGQPAGHLPASPMGGLADPKVAYQINLLMGNVQSMVAREVENQLSQLRAQAEKIMQKGK